MAGPGSRMRSSSGRHRSQVGDLRLPETVVEGRTPVPVVVLLHAGHSKARYGRRLMDPSAADRPRLPHLEPVETGTAAWATALTHIKTSLA